MLSISKETLATLPALEYNGRCLLVETPGKARDAINFLKKHELVGFDTETKPSFHKGQSHKVSLLQLATAEECFLFRLNKTGITTSIKNYLQNPDKRKIGLSVKDDFNSLRRLDNTLQPEGFLELQTWVKDFGILDNSLSRIYAIVFGKRISKSQRLTNWEAEELTQFQQIYAATDAWACLQIYQYLLAGNFDPSTSQYIISDTENLTHKTENNEKKI